MSTKKINARELREGDRILNYMRGNYSWPVTVLHDPKIYRPSIDAPGSVACVSLYCVDDHGARHLDTLHDYDTGSYLVERA